MTKRRFAIEKHDGRSRNRCISEGEARPGSEKGFFDVLEVEPTDHHLE